MTGYVIWCEKCGDLEERLSVDDANEVARRHHYQNESHEIHVDRIDGHGE